MNIIIRKGIAAVVVFLVLILVFLDFQRIGEHVFVSPTLFFEKDKIHSVYFDVSDKHVGDPHRMTVSSRRNKMALAWALYDPLGEIITENREVKRNKGLRFYDFTPSEEGAYKVKVERLRGALAGGAVDVDRRGVDVNPHRREAVSVRVTVNDRRIVMPLLSRLSNMMP